MFVRKIRLRDADRTINRRAEGASVIRRPVGSVVLLVMGLAGCAAGSNAASLAPPAETQRLATPTRWSPSAEKQGVYLQQLELEPDSPSTAATNQDYLARVRARIRASWASPRSERDRGIVGELRIEFHIAHDGRVPFITLRQSSGTPSLDDAALAAVKRAQPFPFIPDLRPGERLPVRGRFRYDTLFLLPHPGQRVAELDVDLSDCSLQVNSAGRLLTTVLLLEPDKFDQYCACLTGK